MIPLHIADQAVAACDAEIAKLRDEVQRLERTEEYLQNTLNRYALDDMRLQAHIERLTKAGDAFYESEIGYYGEQIINDPKHHSGQMCRDWNAAKETPPHA
jgi:chromosome segregation ATPase